MNASALPRIDSRDRRTKAQRTPQTPVTVWVRIAGEQGEEKVHTAVGVGGWASDALHAAARELDVDVEEIHVVAAQGGHV
jgi:hypothetical protein